MTWALHLGRSAFAISLGILLGAGAALIGIEVAAHPSEPAVVESSPSASAAQPPTIVDVSRSALAQTGGSLALVAMLGVGPADPVTAVGGVPAPRGFDDLAAAWDRAAPGDFIDVELARGRRALVLVHP